MSAGEADRTLRAGHRSAVAVAFLLAVQATVVLAASWSAVALGRRDPQWAKAIISAPGLASLAGLALATLVGHLVDGRRVAAGLFAAAGALYLATGLASPPSVWVMLALAAAGTLASQEVFVRASVRRAALIPAATASHVMTGGLITLMPVMALLVTTTGVWFGAMPAFTLVGALSLAAAALTRVVLPRHGAAGPVDERARPGRGTAA